VNLLEENCEGEPTTMEPSRNAEEKIVFGAENIKQEISFFFINAWSCIAVVDDRFLLCY